jgi:YesN/AraC family two-component response regulator
MPDDRRSSAERRTSITVVLVDDEPLIRSALAHTLSVSGLELVGEAGGGEDAIELVLDLRPDVVLIDIKLPDIPGLSLRRLKGACRRTTRGRLHSH